LIDNYSKRDCKNTIFKQQANTNLDESICDKLIFDKQEIVETEENLVVNTEKDYEINNCKNRVYEKQATKNLDSSICKKMINKDEITMCEELVKMELENKKIEEDMKKQDELMNVEEEKRNAEIKTEETNLGF
jgi:hypothetical protein